MIKISQKLVLKVTIDNKSAFVQVTKPLPLSMMAQFIDACMHLQGLIQYEGVILPV